MKAVFDPFSKEVRWIVSEDDCKYITTSDDLREFYNNYDGIAESEFGVSELDVSYLFPKNKRNMIDELLDEM